NPRARLPHIYKGLTTRLMCQKVQRTRAVPSVAGAPALAPVRNRLPCNTAATFAHPAYSYNNINGLLSLTRIIVRVVMERQWILRLRLSLSASISQRSR